MATDKRLDQVSQLTDFDYALLVKGDQVGKMTKKQVAEAIGNLLYGATTKENLASVVAGVLTSAKFTLQSGAEYEFNINTGGIVAITTNALQHGAAILSFPMYGSNVGYLIAGAEAYVAGDVTTTNKIAFWRSEDGKCHIRNNYSSSFVFYYNILSQKS